MVTDRPLLYNLRVTAEERAKLERLAKEEGVPASVLVRGWIKREYAARFESEKPKRGAKR
jgi:hypothetical protein